MFHFKISLKINFSSEMGVCFVSCSMFIEPFKITLVFLLHSFVKPTETRMKGWVSSAIIEEILKSTNFTPTPPPHRTCVQYSLSLSHLQVYTTTVRSQDLCTVQFEPVTPPSVHYTTVRSLKHQSSNNHHKKWNSYHGYGSRRGVKSKIFPTWGKSTQDN